MRIAKETEQSNGSPCEFGASGGTLDAEERSDGVEELFGAPLLHGENFAAQSEECDNLLSGWREDVCVVDEEGDNVSVPLRAFVAS